jgi:hypothetical protein
MYSCGSPNVGGVSGIVEIVVGPIPFGLDYCAFEIEGRSLAHASPNGSSCQHVCHTIGIIPPVCSVRIRDPFGRECAMAGF